MSQTDNISLVKKLRDETFISMLECKKALEISQWNLEQAREYLYTTYADLIAAKKSDRETLNGLLFINQVSKEEIQYIDLRSETDFMLNTDIFHEMGKEILEKNNDKSIINRYIARIGENLGCKEKSIIKGTNLYYYVHGGKTSSTGLYMGVVDFNEKVDENIAIKFCQQVIECGSKDINVFLNYITTDNTKPSEEITKISPSLKINQIYYITVENIKVS